MSKCVEWLAEVPTECREQSIIRPVFWNPAAWLFSLSDSLAHLPWTGYLSPLLWKGDLPQPCVPALIHPPFQKQDLFQKILVPWNPPNQALKATSWRDAINLSNPLITGLQQRLSESTLHWGSTGPTRGYGKVQAHRRMAFSLATSLLLL